MGFTPIEPSDVDRERAMSVLTPEQALKSIADDLGLPDDCREPEMIAHYTHKRFTSFTMATNTIERRTGMLRKAMGAPEDMTFRQMCDRIKDAWMERRI